MRYIVMISTCLFAITACSQNTSAPAEEINNENDWSGSAYFIRRTVGKFSSAGQYVSIESESSTEYRMNATLSRGSGKASSSMKIRSRYKHSSRTGSTVSTSETLTSGDATGSADTEIAVDISDDGSYSFFIPVPACTGKKSVTRTGSGTEVSEFGEDEALIQVEFQPPGDDRDVLTGEIKDSVVGENGEISESILRWALVKGPLDIELLITPENYASWLPIAGKNETTPGASIDIALNLQAKDGKKPKFKAKSFELKLVNTSNEPGVTINYPVDVSGIPKPDMRFRGNANNEGQDISVIPEDGISAVATLDCFDGAAYTQLQAEAILEGGLRITGVLSTAKEITDVTVPKCKPGGKIAEAWLQKYSVTSENADDDQSKGNTNHGDGLTAFQEYRGVMSQEKYTRLDPKTKELGVRIEKAFEAEFEPGLNLFNSATGIEVVKLYPDELGEDRVFNKNRGSSSGGVQHALILLDVRLPKGVVGRNEPETESGKTPARSIRTVIDLQKIKEKFAAQEAAVTAANEKLSFTLEDEIANTVAHELCHGVFVTHHGPNSTVPIRTAYPKKTPPYALYGSDGALLKIPTDGWELSLVGDKIGNESSGDLNCIIAYTSRYQWCFQQLPDRTLEYRAVPVMPPGKTLCTSAEGTGINATGYFGNAQKGNCLSQLKVRDN